MEFDIKQDFDSINRKRLVSILAEEIQDQRFFDILQKMFNADIVGLELGGQSYLEGSPQGSVLAPILGNIYLHKLDLYVDQLIKETNSGTIASRRVDPEMQAGNKSEP